MNRIVLIGNGFDLAHGLKTGYSNFIEWLCENICEELRNKWEESTFNDKYKLVSLTTELKDMNVAYIKDCIYFIKKWDADYNASNKEILEWVLNNQNKKSKVLINEHRRYQCQIKNTMPNRFFNLILKGNNRWADIEQLYYDELLKIRDEESEVIKLNQDFETIKHALQDYLNLLPKPKKIEQIEQILYCPIFFREIKESAKKSYSESIELKYERLPASVQKWYENYKHWRYTYEEMPFIHKLLKNIKELTTENEDLDEFLMPDDVYMLSFNYTNTEDLYEHIYKNKKKGVHIEMITNHIHGELNKSDNSIVFGYGDEYDSNYEQLEKSRVIGVLDNIKSMKYLETTNYRNFETYINSAPYQVVIMGHSCALSDNTLLKTLFEHDNCVSIKPYYYEQVSENNKWNNFHEIIQALSRCFTDKSKLRSVVVNKEWCSPLPQIKREEV